MKVFVSSVMQGFAAERAAARKGVENVGHQPIMAEDFGPRPHSSETACLEGVRTSDVYIGILGERYGWVTDSGRSVTEEEYREAQRRGLPIYFIVTTGAMEPDQQEFRDRVGAYDSGYFHGRFSSPEEIKDGVTQALTKNLPATADNLSSRQASQILNTHLADTDLQRRGEPLLTAATIPLRQDKPWVTLSQLESHEFGKALKRLLLFDATPTLFSDERGIGRVDGRDHLLLTQARESGHAPSMAVGVFRDGTIILHCELQRERGRSLREFGGLDHGILDSSLVEERITAFLSFSAAVYEQIAEQGVLANVHFKCDLKEIGDKLFGKLDGSPVNSVSFPSNPIEDPLQVASETMPLAKLKAGASSARDMVAEIHRTFRAADRAWPQQSRW